MLQTGLEELCFKVAEDSTSQPDDVTLTDVSGTTTSAAGYCGPDTAAFHLEMLGRERWGWQSRGKLLPPEASDCQTGIFKFSTENCWTFVLNLIVCVSTRCAASPSKIIRTDVQGKKR